MAHNASFHKQFQATVVETAELFGYTTMGVFPLVDRQGIYRTPTTLKGWPDLTLIRPPRLLAIEIKTGTGKLREDQRAVLTLMSQIPCVRAWVIHPDDDWQEFVGWLRRPATAPAVAGFAPMEGDPHTFLKRATKHERARATARVPRPSLSTPGSPGDGPDTPSPPPAARRPRGTRSLGSSRPGGPTLVSPPPET